MNPWLMAGSAFLQALPGLFGGDTPQDKLMKFMLAQRRKAAGVINPLAAQGPKDVIGAPQMAMQTANFQQALRPYMQQYANRAAQRSGLDSGEAYRDLANQNLSRLAQFRGGLQQQNIQLSQDRFLNLLRLMAGLG